MNKSRLAYVRTLSIHLINK